MGETMSDESKTMAAAWVLTALMFIAILIFARMADNKIHALENNLKEARKYCIGKENKLEWCENLYH